MTAPVDVVTAPTDGVTAARPEHRGTIAEQILSAHAGRDVRAGDIAVCSVDWVLGTDASSPMAIDYFEAMGGERLFDPARVLLSLDHYAPPTTVVTRGFHERMREFARRHGAAVPEVGDGISFQRLVESGRALPGELVIGADSHTVTCGALNLFATGLGSSDIAAAMLTGTVWLRVPETIRVTLHGRRTAGTTAKDVALEMVAVLGADGANYCAIEFTGDAIGDFSLDERLVLSNLAVETDAKAAIWPAQDLAGGVTAGPTARYVREVAIPLDSLSPRIALPHAPDLVRPLEVALGTPVHMVFLGTCTGGRASDIRAALAAFEREGGARAPGVQLVVTPASRAAHDALESDGTLARLRAVGATVTTAGCGACCGTSGVLPGDGMNVLSTANRNFKGRMGNPTARIYLASPAVCGAAAARGMVVEPGVA